MRPGTLLALALIAGISAPAQAVLLYSQPLDGYHGQLLSDFGDDKRTADDFTLADAGTATEIVFWGGITGSEERPMGRMPNDDAFTIEFFFEGEDGLESMEAFAVGNSASTELAFTEGDFEIWKYTADLGAGIFLDTIPYHVSVTNNTAGPNEYWHWANAAYSGSAAQKIGNGGWETSPLGNLAFELRGGNVSDVPEPSTVAILGFGLLGLTWTSVRRRGQR